MTRVAIVGSRWYPEQSHVRNFVMGLPKDTVVLSGGAKGVDSWAEKWARYYGLDVEVFPADWEKHGRRAGYLRNVDIVNACDRVVAFWDGASPGTRHTIEIARKAGKPVAIHRPGRAS